jgi:ABC-type sugar transport system permease subunit
LELAQVIHADQKLMAAKLAHLERTVEKEQTEQQIVDKENLAAIQDRKEGRDRGMFWLGIGMLVVAAISLIIAVVVAEIWRSTAVVLLIVVAGLQLIPKEFGEVADIFGASPWQKLIRVTLPTLKPTLQSALILRTVLAFEVFAAVYAIGGRNIPVLVGEAYLWQRENQNYSVAAAYAVLIMVISLAATAVYLAVLRQKPEVQA